jgi:hypothetical protein
MNIQDPHQSAQSVHESSNRPPRGDGGERQPTRPRLMRVSEVERNCDPASPLRCVLDWIREFLARPHPQLGRTGPVCPFVPVSLELDTIWMTAVAEATPSFEHISAIITDYRNVFLETEPTKGPEALNKAILVVFPSLSANGTDGAAVIDRVQANLKKYFVEMGLMLGEFHAANESPGLRNPAFRPLRSPIPMLAIRHMVESDLPFLIRATYPPKDRASFLRSYLFRLGGDLSQTKFNEALDGLIAAEAAMAVSPAGNPALIVCPI